LWTHGLDLDSAELNPTTRIDALQGELRINADGIARRIADDEASWKCWVERYQASLEVVGDLPLGSFLKEAECTDWDTLRDLIVHEIAPFANVKVINSEETADERPSFELRDVPENDEKALPPEDLLTVFVSGNVMSRGITIEGLSTSVFLRSTSSPAADTQMQMQRWFGYRGGMAHLVRLFTYEDQLELFSTYHEHDVLVRTEILSNMDLKNGGKPPRTLLHGPRSTATSKVPSQRVPLSPGPQPSVRILEPTHGNEQVLTNLLSKSDAHLLPLSPTLVDKGRILTRTYSLHEVADILDQFEYASHDPTEESSAIYNRWSAMKKRYNFPAETHFFRPDRDRDAASGQITASPSGCPYTIAAYLRLWAAALKHSDLRGLYVSDRSGGHWSVERLSLTAPEFYVGIRSGSQGAWAAEPQIRCMLRNAVKSRDPLELETLWGSNPARGTDRDYLGDKRFDYHYSQLPSPPLPTGREMDWRPRGDPGLILFHVIHPHLELTQPLVTVSLCLPHGGPDQIAALR
jgi:hypothetical protein